MSGPTRLALAAALAMASACGGAEGEPPGYVDLWAAMERAPECVRRIQPHREGRSCASGAYDRYEIRRISDVGARPVWSPDGTRIAYVDRHWGDAWEIDPETGDERCLTCGFDHQGFWRVHYLRDGDFLLLGPQRFTSRLRSRLFGNGLFWMPADASAPPRWLGIEHFEGIAVSRESRRIAWATVFWNPWWSWPHALRVAEIAGDGEVRETRTVHRSRHVIEAQDFMPGDRGLVFARYTGGHDVVTLDFETGQVVNQTRDPHASEEPEGLFPDGVFTLMESDRHDPGDGEFDLDIYMLRLDGSGRDVRRLTHFNDSPDEKATNPVVSPEGCRIAFMKGKRTDDRQELTGGSDGLFLLEFYECADTAQLGGRVSGGR